MRLYSRRFIYICIYYVYILVYFESHFRNAFLSAKMHVLSIMLKESMCKGPSYIIR